MTVRLSTGLRNALAQGLGFMGVMARGSIQIYSGTQPINADQAPGGTLLGTVTLSSAALTQETRGSASFTLSGTSGTVNSITVSGLNIIPNEVITYTDSLTNTAALVAAAVNRCGVFTATSSGAVVTIRPRPGTGAAYNGLAVVVNTTTLSATAPGNITGGVTPVNGLTLVLSDTGVVSKSGTWSFSGITGGTAGWFRYIASEYDDGSVTGPARMDGSIGSSGADMVLSNLNIAAAAPNTIDSFSFTVPIQ